MSFLSSFFTTQTQTHNHNQSVKNNTDIIPVINNIKDIEPVIINSKFNKNINEQIKNEGDNEENNDRDNKENNEEDDMNDVDNADLTVSEDNFTNYIIPESIQPYTKNAESCKFNWNGILLLEKWELQRKVDIKHATNLAKSLKKDYIKYGEFIFYDPIHIGKKTNDNKYYVLDGQHRLEAYQYFYERNSYPIQQIPIILWYANDEEHFIELFHKINSRLSIDKLKLIQIKLLEIFEGMEGKYGKNIWGIKRPKINKDMLAEKLKNSESVHKLSTEEILNKLFKINENLRKMPRSSRVKPTCVTSIHNSAETMDFFLGLDKIMKWIEEI